MDYEAIVIGVSSGGMNALKLIFSAFPSDFAVPVIVVQHIGPRSENSWIKPFKRTVVIFLLKKRMKKKKLVPGIFMLLLLTTIC